MEIYSESHVFQDAATGTGNGTTMEVSGLSAVGVQVEGITSATVTFEGTIDGSTWYAVQVANINNGAIGTTTTADGLFLAPVLGLAQFRCRISTYATGTITATGVGVVNAGITLADIDVAGTETVTANAGTNLNTSALALEVGGNLATIAGAVAGTEVRADIVASLPAGTNAIGKLAANSGVDIGDVDLLIPGTWASAAVDGSTSGDNELVALVGGSSIYIVGITLVSQGDVEVVLESGIAGPDLTGAVSLSADGQGFVWPVAARGWWAKTDSGESLNMRLDAAIQVTGIVAYYTG